MEKLVLKIKDGKKIDFIRQLLGQFDFVEVLKDQKQPKQKAEHNFFESVGMWAERDIDAKELRKKAWKK